MNFPPDAKAVLSTDFGKRPVRQLQRNAPTTIHTNFLQDIGSKAEFYVKTYREYLVETDLKPPINYSDLYPYFDPFDLWVEGPGFLYHVTCRVVQISINMREQLAAFASAWCNNDINNEKLLLVRVGVPFDEIFNKADWDFIDADRLPHHEVGGVLSQIQRIAHIRFPGLPAAYAIPQNLPEIAQQPVQYGNNTPYGANRKLAIDNTPFGNGSTQFGSNSQWADNSEYGIDTVPRVFRLFGDSTQITQSAPRLVSFSQNQMGAPIAYPMTPQQELYPNRGQAMIGGRSSSARHGAFAWQVEDPFTVSRENTNNWIHSLNARDAETRRQNSTLSASDVSRFEDASTPIQQTSVYQPPMNQSPMQQAQIHQTPVQQTVFGHNFQQGPLSGPHQFALENSASPSSSASRFVATPVPVRQNNIGSHVWHGAFDGAHQPAFEDLSDDNHNPSQRLKTLQGDVVWTNKLERPAEIKAPEWAVESKNRVTETFLVNAGAAGAIIGRGGSHIESIKNKWDCVVKLSEVDTYEGFRTCWITGRPRQREGAAFHVVGLVENWRAKVASSEWGVAPPRLGQFSIEERTSSMEHAEDGRLEQRRQQSDVNAPHRSMKRSAYGSWNKTVRPLQQPYPESFERFRNRAQPPRERLGVDTEDDADSVITYKSDGSTGSDETVCPQEASMIDVNNETKPIVPTPLSKPCESASLKPMGEFTHNPPTMKAGGRPSSQDWKAIQRENQKQSRMENRNENHNETPKASLQKNHKGIKGKGKATQPKYNAASKAPEALRDLRLGDSNNWPTLGGAKPIPATRGRGWDAMHEEPKTSMVPIDPGSLGVPGAFAALAAGPSDAQGPSSMSTNALAHYNASGPFDNRRGSFSNVVARHRPTYVPVPPQPMVRNNQGRGVYGDTEGKAQDWEWPVATSFVEAAQMANKGKVPVFPQDALMTHGVVAQGPPISQPSVLSPEVMGSGKGNGKGKGKDTTFVSAFASAALSATLTADATAAIGDNSARGSKSSSGKKKIGKGPSARRAREARGNGDSREGAGASRLGLGGASSSGNVDTSIDGGAGANVGTSGVASSSRDISFAGSTAEHARSIAQPPHKADWFKAQRAWNYQAEKENGRKLGKDELSEPW